ncbi:MAG: bifunctional folylpolyglutamate synthase/dihydrofolate synthase [Rhodobacteraceae bacterium]|nr:bifunctional folylpolyglutamate synthase/dihydrofolate synthase [Paracoccaceae bacterium]
MRAETSDIILEKMMALHPKIIDLTLDRVWRLLEALDHPETRLPPVVHIAGTNGKGSTLAMIRAGIEGAGQTAHAYTSPHLARFNERIRVAGDLIEEDQLADVLEICWKANAGAAITYFEITTIAALVAFVETTADWTLLEVGLGGRLDATNVVERPALTVITPVAFDHEQYLGDTITKIAREKAGIIKRGVPCVVGPQRDEALEVIEDVAARMGSELLVYGQHWHVWEERGRLVYQDERGLLDLPHPILRGEHQVRNAGAALAALRHLGFDEAACEHAMTDAVWPARMQRLKTGPLVDAAGTAEVWLDGGHNPAAGAAVAQTLDELPERQTHLIVGMLSTKDVIGFLAPIAARAVGLHAVDIPDAVATLPAKDTASAGRDVGLDSRVSGSVLEAVQDIIAQDPEARILICGSLYLAGAVLQENG